MQGPFPTIQFLDPNPPQHEYSAAHLVEDVEKYDWINLTV
jgi:hypothetical protein